LSYVISVNASGTGTDDAVNVLTEHFKMPEAVLSSSDGEFSWSHRAVGDLTMILRSVQFSGTLEATLDSGIEFVIQWARSGQVAFESKRTSIVMHTDIPFVSPNGRCEMRTRMIDANLNLIHIGRSVVETIAEELDDVHFVTFDVVTPLSARTLASWRNTVQLVTAVVLDTSEPATSLLRREMSRMVAVSLLTNFPFQSIPHASNAAGVEPSAVRRAIEFAHHNAHLPIGTDDLAHAAGLSVRALRLALRRHRNITPTALIQSIRLDLVHGQLLAADAKTTSVFLIARDWGFVHLGRFAASYRRLHGESPSQTLSRTLSATHRTPSALSFESLF
jgi:AraC-like DNA-binding protein